ncbi:MAG: RluA family pseudouridine synthase [Armatimonadetes bacterium]|nr:RluA family pseudouridine synthase [Armatimonadota bacterium]
MPENFRFVVQPEEAGQRLDVVVTSRLDGLSRARVQRLIAAGHVRLNAQIAPSRTPVAAQSVVEGEIAFEDAGNTAAEDADLEIIYEDQHLAVVNKPRGLAVHPGAGRSSGTLVNILAARFRHLPEGSDPGRPGIVHRLDKDTSGLLLVALSAESMTALSELIAERKVERRYQALVWGSPRFNRALVDAAIGRDPRHPEKMAVLAAQGPDKAREALTELVVQERFSEATLLEAKLSTGRTHQIRVHCAYAGHGIVGDATYHARQRLPGKPGSQDSERFRRLLEALDGQALHAKSLALKHPLTGAALSFEVEMPQPMADMVEFFRGRSFGIGQL